MSEAPQVTSVEIIVGKNPVEDCVMVMSYDKKKPIEKSYDSWTEASKQAAAIAFRTGLDSVDVVFRLQSGEYRFQESTPNVDKGERLSPAIAVVERRLERLGFECNYITGGQWVIHRPDPAGGYSRRGYFSAAQIVELGASDSGAVDGAIKAFSSNKQPTRMVSYMQLSRGDSMATKAKATKAVKAEKPEKEVVTVKVDGEEVQLSPKQAEVWAQIQERSDTDEPLGSDDERLSDPDSIAAMKLATEIGCAHRAKFGNRWWYFASEKDMNARVKAFEKEAEEAEAIKTAAKKPSKVTESPKAAAGKGTAKKAKAPLKKPSEK